MNLSSILGKSEFNICEILAQKNDKELRRQIPAISEIYSTFYALDLDEIKPWDPSAYPSSEGVYSHQDKLISVTRINRGQFKYIAMFCSGALDAAALSSIANTSFKGISDSVVHDVLAGFYVCILKKVENCEFYEPEAFTYLISEVGIENEIKNSVIPFLALPSTIPINQISIWVYLGLKHFSEEFISDVEYAYLLETDDEKKTAGESSRCP